MQSRVHLHTIADRLHEGLEALAGRVACEPHARGGKSKLETLDRHLCPIVGNAKSTSRPGGW